MREAYTVVAVLMVFEIGVVLILFFVFL